MSFPNKAEQVGVLSPYAINPDDIGVNWGTPVSVQVIDTGAYLGSGVIVYGGVNARIIRSVDYGATWTTLNTRAAANIVYICYLGNGIVLFTTSTHIWRSTDFGVNWTDLGVITVGLGASGGMVYLGNGIVLMGDSLGSVYRSTDFGVTWAGVAGNPISTAFIDGFIYYDNGIVTFIDDAQHIFRSTDYGVNWTDLGIVSSTTSYINVGSYLSNGIAIYGDINGHIFRTSDYGLTWKDLGIIVGQRVVASVYVGNGIVLVGDSGPAALVFGHIWKSTDYGLTWTDLGAKTTSTAPIEVLIYLGNGVVSFCTGDSVIIRSDISYKLDECMPSISVGMSVGVGNTSGTSGLAYQQLVIVGSNNMTLSQSITSGSATITLSAVASAGAGSFTMGVSTGGNTSGATRTVSNQVILVGGNNVTLSESVNGQSATVTISLGAATFSAGVSIDGIGTTGTVSNRVIFAGGNNVTLSESSNGGSATITISAAVSPYAFGVSTGGNTSGSTGTIGGLAILVGGNNITLSESSNAGSATITISAAVSPFGAGISDALGNTSGNTGTVSQQLIFAGGNNVTVSQSINGQSATVSISLAAVGAGSFSAGISNIGNTSGTIGTINNQLLLVGGNNVTLSENINGQSGTITISMGSISGQSVRLFQPIEVGDITRAGIEMTANDIFIQRVSMPVFISATEYDIIGSLSLATNSTGGYSFLYGIYTMTGSTANLITNSTTIQGTTFTSGSATSASGQYGGQSDRRFRSASLGTWNLTPGEYLYAIMLSTKNNVSMTLNGPHRISVAGIPGGGNYTPYFFDGLFSTTSNALPLSMNITDIIRTGDNLQVWWLALIGT